VPTCPDSGVGSGTGLTGTYYADYTWTTIAFTRVDSTINFNWGTGSPGGSVPVDYFVADWTGLVRPQYSGTWTFTLSSDDGSQLVLGGVTVIDAWVIEGQTEHSGAVVLTGGAFYAATIKYFEATGNAALVLYWSHPTCQAKQVIPTSALYPH